MKEKLSANPKMM